MRGLILVAALALASCGGNPKAECTRIGTGEVLRGHAVTDMNGDIHHYEVADRNGLMGAINASNSSSFSCKTAALGDAASSSEAV